MTQQIFLALFMFSLVSSVTPGPNNLMLMASGANYGFRRTIPHMVGVSGGFTLMVVLVGVGLMQLFDRVPYSYLTLKIGSVLYLLWLAWKIATAGEIKEKSNNNSGKPFTFIQAALFQWVNPKAWAMALTAISAYTPADHSLGSVLIVAGVFGMINLPNVSLWAFAGTQIRRFLNNPVRLRIFNVTMALLLVATLWPIVTGLH